ncbi:MAG: UDP-2,3-diacylglucosamine diphosphatase [Pseudomonadota bacterium]
MAVHRTLFISDIHLGARASQADLLVDFLSEHSAETVYLVGDIVDFWRIKRGPRWPESNNQVLQMILRMVRQGSRVVYIPGNHDDEVRAYCGSQFGGIAIERNAIHETADGKRYLIMHGDEFDVVSQRARWLAVLGDYAYQVALWSNVPVNIVRRRFGLGYWSLSAYLKGRVKAAVNFIGDFEHMLSDEAKKQNVDGVICGHIHQAASKMFGETHYINTGDWVESCTAVVETDSGSFELIRWLEVAGSPAEQSMSGQEIGVAV